MYRSISNFVVTAMLLFAAKAFSHQPNQLTYTFKVDADKPTLKIHFTPKTLLDILEFVQPDLKYEPMVNLYDHKDKLRDYFGGRILIDNNNLKDRLTFGEMDLLAHDAYITFVLDSSFRTSNGLEIQINSLTDLYSRVENFVFVKYEGTTKRYALSHKNRKVWWENNSIDNEKESGFTSSYTSWTVLMLSLIFMGLTLLFLKRKKSFSAVFIPKTKVL